MPENLIDDFIFVAIRGEVIPPRQTLELDQRNGVAGTEFTKLAKKGKPFQLFTQVDAESYEAAIQAAKDYGDLIDEGPVRLVVHDIDFTGFGYQLKVLDVTPVNLKRIGVAVGGLFPPSLGWCECAWDVLAVEV